MATNDQARMRLDSILPTLVRRNPIPVLETLLQKYRQEHNFGSDNDSEATIQFIIDCSTALVRLNELMDIAKEVYGEQ